MAPAVLSQTILTRKLGTGRSAIGDGIGRDLEAVGAWRLSFGIGRQCNACLVTHFADKVRNGDITRSVTRCSMQSAHPQL